MDYVLKKIPEDFRVYEKFSYTLLDDGRFSLFLVTKKEWNTLDLVRKIVSLIGCRMSDVGFCGNKDRIAITKQYFSVPMGYMNKLKSISIDNVDVEYIGQIEERLTLGDLDGNRFEIVARDLDCDLTDKFSKLDFNKVPNYFGTQRFGTNNAEIAYLIIKGKMKNACELLIEDDYYKKKIETHLEKNQNDYVGAMTALGKKILKLYIHAYQSKLWNNVVKIMLEKEESLEQQEIPIVGFATELTGKVGKYYDKILRKDKVSERDFIIRQIKEISSEGAVRNIFMHIEDFKFKFLDDEIFDGKKKCELSFYLGKGSYATTLIVWLFE